MRKVPTRILKLDAVRAQLHPKSLQSVHRQQICVGRRAKRQIELFDRHCLGALPDQRFEINPELVWQRVGLELGGDHWNAAQGIEVELARYPIAPFT